MNEISLIVKLPNGSKLTTFEDDENLYRAIVRALIDVEVFLIEMDVKNEENNQK
ncbi:hypothetical protein [Lactococcus lactis]|uniref:hypothetical protein n=1 Tax=Lactococcus lactis TaxID=1358 RepID=UPI00240DDBC0|nr:hypothetical protein [Lactococcus lactis]WFB95380.1 hypothetical protein PDI73_08275 [Lactococcus lactis]